MIDFDELEELFAYLADSDCYLLQLRAEILWALGMASEYLGGEAKVALELGSWTGGNLVLLSKLLRDDGVVIGVEPGLNVPLMVDEVAEMISPVQLVHVPHMSCTPQALVLVADALQEAGSGIDVLFIDASHSYENVSRDYREYSPLVSTPGVIMFHDIVGNSGSSILWNELRQDRAYDAKVAFLDDEYRRAVRRSGQTREHPSPGIGILYK